MLQQILTTTTPYRLHQTRHLRPQIQKPMLVERRFYGSNPSLNHRKLLGKPMGQIPSIGNLLVMTTVMLLEMTLGMLDTHHHKSGPMSICQKFYREPHKAWTASIMSTSTAAQMMIGLHINMAAMAMTEETCQSTLTRKREKEISAIEPRLDA